MAMLEGCADRNEYARVLDGLDVSTLISQLGEGIKIAKDEITEVETNEKSARKKIDDGADAKKELSFAHVRKLEQNARVDVTQDVYTLLTSIDHFKRNSQSEAPVRVLDPASRPFSRFAEAQCRWRAAFLVAQLGRSIHEGLESGEVMKHYAPSTGSIEILRNQNVEKASSLRSQRVQARPLRGLCRGLRLTQGWTVGGDWPGCVSVPRGLEAGSDGEDGEASYDSREHSDADARRQPPRALPGTCRRRHRSHHLPSAAPGSTQRPFLQRQRLFLPRGADEQRSTLSCSTSALWTSSGWVLASGAPRAWTSGFSCSSRTSVATQSCQRPPRAAAPLAGVSPVMSPDAWSGPQELLVQHRCLPQPPESVHVQVP
jgi:hypothetical protein